MSTLQQTLEQLQAHFAGKLNTIEIQHQELNLSVDPKESYGVCQALCHQFQFEQLIDLCGIDYLHYGKAEWETTTSSSEGFSRGVDEMSSNDNAESRFAVVYHLLSLQHNQRCRIIVKLSEAEPIIASVMDIWSSANWYEREAFDLFGILFDGHNDLRRLLTDYGFIGHPFRKDFPLIGEVEVIYDETLKRVVYQPVSIEERILVPKVIRTEQAVKE